MPRAARPRKNASCTGDRSARQLAGHAVAEGDGQILLGRVGLDSAADAAGRRHGALRRRRGRLLRLSALEVAAVQRGPHVARSTGPVLDRHGLAGGRIVHRPAGQRAGTEGTTPGRQRPVLALLLVVVVGSLTGEWLSIHNKLSDAVSFYFGHQGYEYVDLGRAWQIALFVGLLLWLFLMIRVLRPALRKEGEQKQLVALLAVATGAIALFYGAGLTWGQHTHLSMVEYWRWWVVHLWVEGFFEVFATTVIAFFFMRLNLIRPGIAAAAALLSATIFLSGGIIGTCHHLYFSGTPTVALAWGSVFSALEVVPLVLVGFDAMEDLRRSRTSPWVQRYKWPIYFFVAVAFWNMVGAGLFGFMINPPIALYYMQGLNTTPLHGHAALFGVYGMLGIGLMLVCLRVLIPGVEWKDGLLRFSFWSLNGGLMAMCVLSLLPVGLMQTWASVEHGYWYARSSEFMQTRSDADSALDASARRHDLLSRSRGVGRVRRRTEDRTLVSPNGVM